MSKLWVENISNPRAYYQETEPSFGGSWIDNLTLSLDNQARIWRLHGNRVMDIIHWRDKIQNCLIPIANPNYPTIDFSGYSAMDNDLQIIMCELFLAPYSLRISTTNWSEKQDYNAWEYLLDQTKGLNKDETRYTGRALIADNMRKAVAHRVRKELITMTISQEFAKDVDNFIRYYVEYAAPDLIMWMCDSDLTYQGQPNPYYLIGFSVKNYFSEDLKTELITIYNGE